ncbi:MAG TPA: class I SAM-dependent methyltransferase [Gammaproteobacteria bacterium]|nr:class I SAM-dependent methyltransferase [Gammaproteobacteria bacterium]
MLSHDYPDSYGPLCRRLGLERGLPFTPQWSAEADFLELLADRVRDAAPTQILECSSGLSTLVLARACELAGRGRVLSLENGAEYAETTRAALAAYGLQSWARVVHAPLVEKPLPEGSWQWYDLQGLDIPPVDLLVIDGPPGFLQPLSRYPALPLLADRLAPGCCILLDDAAREDEQALVARWRRRWPQMRCENLPLARGCVRLEWPRG